MPTLIPFDIDGYCLGVTFINERPAYLMADGMVYLDGNGVALHDGLASFARSADRQSVITGGEDGRICRLDGRGAADQLATIGNKWITSVACGPQNSFAFAAMRKVWYREKQELSEQLLERSVESLAFAPKGQRLAIAYCNGVTLEWIGTKSPPTHLEWNGAHNMVTFSPDGRFLVTAMQENALHGWRLADNQHLRMTGYPTKVKSWSWSVKGKWLATSGASAAIVWPFSAKEGPMGKAPLEIGTRATNLVSAVAFHPREEAVAIGYDDGMILFVRLADGQEVPLRHHGKAAITSLCWDDRGLRLLFGAQSGGCGLIDIGA